MSTSDTTRSLARTLALATGLGFAIVTGAAAQEATTPPAATPPMPTDLSMGQEVSNGPGPIPTPETAAIGETYLQANFETWEQRCVKTEDGSDPCQLYQMLKDEAGGPMAEVMIFDLPEGSQAAAGATIVVPLETLLTANLQLTIDTSKAKIYPFTFCVPIGCVANIGFTAEEIEQFRKGAGAVLTIVPAFARDQKVNVDISLKGFTAGFKAVADANADIKAP